VDDDEEESEVQNGCCTFVPCKSNKKTGLTKVVLAASQKKQLGGELAGVLVLCQNRFSASRGFE